MLAGTGLTICPDCGKTVPAALGFCELCGEQFSITTIETHVVELEAA